MSVWGVLALFLASALMAVVMRSVIQAQRQLRQTERTIQADLIHQAACARLRARLPAGTTPADDTWDIPAEELASQHPAQATIRWSPDSPESSARTVTVSVRYPASSPTPIRRESEWSWDGQQLTPVERTPSTESAPAAP